MKLYNFSIIIEQDQDGYFATCPQLQGCYTQGETYEKALENIKDVIKLHVEDKIVNKEEVARLKSISLSTVEVEL